MPYYETVYIARQDLTDAQVKAMTEEFTKILTDMGGKIHKIEEWGLRSLAYKIRKNRKGHYVLIESDAPTDALTELERKMRLNEDVLRYMSIKEEKLSDGLSVIMDKGSKSSDRDTDNKPTSKEEAA